MNQIQQLKTLIQTEFPGLARTFGRFHLSHDRRVIEDIIFPYIGAKSELNKILFVGCDWYTKDYNNIFTDRDYWTIDIDPKKRRFGGRNHITDSLGNLGNYFSENYFDLILCNGVFLVGAMDDRNDIEISFNKCFECLRNDGTFIVGWNDTPDLRPFPLEECQSLKQFKPYIFPPLATSQYLTNTSYKHTYNFYIK